MIRTTILFFLFFMIQTAFAKQVVFSGTVKNATSDEVRISLLINELTQERSIFVCRLNTEETFSISIDVPMNQVVHFIYEEKKAELFVDLVYPKIEFEIDHQNWEKSLFFKGDSGPNNQFFKTFRHYYLKPIEESESYNLGFLNTVFDKETAQRAKAYSVHDFFNYLDDKMRQQQRYLNNEPRISRAMRDFARNEINWRYETNKLGYFLLNKDHIPTHKLRDYWLQYRLMQSVDIGDEDALQYWSFQNMLSAFIHYLHLETLQGKDEDLDLDFYRFIDRNLSGKPRFFMQGKLMLNAYQNGYPDLAQRKFKGYIRFNPYQEYTQTLEYIFGNNLDHVRKETVADFTFLDTQNQTQYLSNYRGKVVFVSLWASWCAPCLKGFRETHDARAELERMGVVFLNVNIDETEQAWRRTLPQVQVPGKHVYGLDLQKFQQQMGFKTLPFYALIDKYGRLNYLATEDINTSKEDFLALLRQ